MDAPERSTEVGAALRALRRAADLSQRQLAAESGVPQATIARIESGRSSDPGFRTIERLVAAVGGRIRISGRDADGLRPVPHEALRDAAGRHCPAHLDAREVREPRDWPGAWWAHWYNVPPGRWPRLPAATYRLDRSERDRQRERDRVRQHTTVRRYADPTLPSTSWRFVAELPDGELVGELRAHERSDDLLIGQPRPGRPEIVLDGVLVATPYQLLGIGRRLVEALVAEMDRAGIHEVHAVAEFGGIQFLLACGFALQASRPAALRLERPISAVPTPPR
ncbi:MULTISPECIES: GNAT family N-acetyltransferase [Micromonospora]|uniref:GNAT family N-acetyltransferase n=1 Tax=Micromonospora solifontis TaxID=2487138 RepID=A0ABX9W8P5_9ACTN|nr:MULTISPECIES: GNAT family N-acetyltransferase [Micromonospora]NES17255.1 GNAT family N-acetyltransferase [Micromonospora sp. PPF5-17B]NES39597.1 GNAT family N-acetyltransferase [Micromonospora solifontis]NES59071.1 GNAT family N-acetyltransferase [Micromonospora sp. PPF5-6]RNL88029.1 GNAT family N-acetyltransferase [Micromonospora solifontis]